MTVTHNLNTGETCAFWDFAESCRYIAKCEARGEEVFVRDGVDEAFDVVPADFPLDKEVL